MTYKYSQLDPHCLSAEDFSDKTIVLDITRSVVDHQEKGESDIPLTPMHVMSYAQRAWRLNPDNARDAELILAVYKSGYDRRLIVGAFVFGRQDSPDGPDCFVPSPYKERTPERYIFLAESARAEVWNRYVGHYLAPRKQGEANPVKYYMQD